MVNRLCAPRAIRRALYRAGIGTWVVVASAAGLVAVSAPAHATGTTITVTSAADPGDGRCTQSQCTLREALALSNASSGGRTIKFAVGTGPITISLAKDLPIVTKRVTIDGTTQPGYVGQPLVEISGQPLAELTGQHHPTETGLWLSSSSNAIRGLVINGFTDQDMLVDGSSNVISGNYIGTTASGNATTGGGTLAALRIRGSASHNTVSGNVIGGGTAAVGVEGSATGNSLLGNSIGVGADGVSAIGAGTGVLLTGPGVRGTDIRGNSIAFNSGLGIDINNDGPDVNDPNDGDTGPNNKQNYPIVTGVVSGPAGVSVSGTLNSNSAATFTVEVFASQSCDTSGFGEGQSFVGSFDVVTDAAGDASFSTTIPAGATSPPPAGYDSYTATATQAIGGSVGHETSEFSACRPVTPTNPPASPTGVAVGAGDAQAEVSWIASASDGGSSLDHYTVSSSPDTASTPFDVPAGTTTTTVPGLANGTSYSFTVTATNKVGKTSDPSAPSTSVIPEAGAAAPESATAEVSADGSLTTGADASAADPTNTTINTPNAGIVSIGEGAMTGAPPAGVTYFGQQVDVAAPEASAANPLAFTFVLDCSVLPVGTSTCGGLAAAQAEAAPAVASAPAAAAVTVNDGSYSPKVAAVGLGGTVTWNFQGTKHHSVVDSRHLGSKRAALFSSGTKPPGSSYSFAFLAAGGYPYASTVSGDPTTMVGTIEVPVEVSQTSAEPSTPVTVSWATGRSADQRFDVQYRFRAPGTATYSGWRSFRANTSMTSGTFTGAGLCGEGDYQFRSRLKNSGTGKTSLWSPAATVSVVGGRHLADIAVFHETDTANAEVPDCTGPEGVAQPAPECTWSERILADGDLEVVVYTADNGRWRAGKTTPG